MLTHKWQQALCTCAALVPPPPAFLLRPKAGRWVLNMLGVIADNEDTVHTGAPEFPVAVRTQLLVGEASYAIQDQPAYAAAFTKMEHMEEDVCVKVRAAV